LLTFVSNRFIIFAMSDTVVQKDSNVTEPIKKKSKAGKAFKIGGVILLLAVFAVLVLNSLLVLFMDDYYTTFGNYRLFAIVSDSMEPAIPTGSMIVDEKPENPADIHVGSVITFKYNNGTETVLITHRVVAIETKDGVTQYTTKGDNAKANDAFKPKFTDIVGIYTGKKCGFFGSLFGFFQSPLGVSVLIFGMFIIIVAWVVIWYVNTAEGKHKLKVAALKKSTQALSNVNLRYDNINEITAVMDVLDMVTQDPKTKAERKLVADRLREFIKAENIELPQTPETAAMLDTLPAPDTPSALSAALSAGATLRQAEDGQTLVLTTISGDKNILLTPVQTPDGIILCQQGVRMRSDLAPNIEDVGITSMPASPEFFEGLPLEKSVEYPELPQPSAALGPEILLHGETQPPQLDKGYSSPHIVGGATVAAIAAPSDGEQPLLESREARNAPAEKREYKPTEADERRAKESSRLAYAQYREASSQLELRQAEQLSVLLNETAPLTYDEQLRVAEYKAAHKKPKKPKKSQTPEQKAAAKEAAERRKLAEEAFLNTLSSEDRELYLTEQKLAKSRAATIRRLKRIAADRKLLDKLD
ncbi:MAG: signal peptidase I, partial [Clostridiales bacterium]|nr:signal peptidase I [Clostridiales bacterium]